VVHFIAGFEPGAVLADGPIRSRCECAVEFYLLGMSHFPIKLKNSIEFQLIFNALLYFLRIVQSDHHGRAPCTSQRFACQGRDRERREPALFFAPVRQKRTARQEARQPRAF
jgi:hypothetical protein